MNAKVLSAARSWQLRSTKQFAGTIPDMKRRFLMFFSGICDIISLNPGGTVYSIIHCQTSC